MVRHRGIATITAVLVGLAGFGTASAGADDGVGDGDAYHLPAQARRIDDHLVDLGELVDPTTGRRLHGTAHLLLASDLAAAGVRVDEARGGGRGGGGGGGGGGKPASTVCYELSDPGPWSVDQLALDWTVYPDDGIGIPADQVVPLLTEAAGLWNGAAGRELLAAPAVGDVGTAPSSIGYQNGHNEVVFKDIASEGTVAMVVTWTEGKGKNRHRVEFDMVYDDVDWSWAPHGGDGTIDFFGVAAHEHGHALGLGHPDPDRCADQIMHYYAAPGVVKGSELRDGDIAGIRALYAAA